MDEETRRLVDATMIGEAVESLPVAIFVSDASLNFLAVNTAAADLLGVPRGELVRRRVPDVVPRPHGELQQAALAAESQGMQVGEGTLRRDDGSLVEIAYATMAARIGTMPVLVSFVRPKAAEDPGRLLDALLAGVRESAPDPRD